MRQIATIPLAFILLLAATPATATEPLPVPGDGGSPSAQGTLATEVESARMGTVGWLEAELAYRAAINAYRVFDNELTLHTMDLLLGYPVRDTMEFRAGWRMFGVVPGDDFDQNAGVGDPWIDAKFALRQLPEADYPHTLSIVGRFQPGIGQTPATVTGVTFAALALYTVRIGEIELDGNAGVQVNTDDNPSYFSLPIGGRIVWLAEPWMNVYGEVVETLHFTDLRSSETQIAAGCALRPIDQFEFNVTGGIGLSESLPAGFIQLGVAFHAANFGTY